MGDYNSNRGPANGFHPEEINEDASLGSLDLNDFDVDTLLPILANDDALAGLSAGQDLFGPRNSFSSLPPPARSALLSQLAAQPAQQPSLYSPAGLPSANVPADSRGWDAFQGTAQYAPPSQQQVQSGSAPWPTTAWPQDASQQQPTDPSHSSLSNLLGTSFTVYQSQARPDMLSKEEASLAAERLRSSSMAETSAPSMGNLSPDLRPKSASSSFGRRVSARVEAASQGASGLLQRVGSGTAKAFQCFSGTSGGVAKPAGAEPAATGSKKPSSAGTSGGSAGPVRNKTAEAREKARLRNRRAQKAFRERQRSRQQERQEVIGDLTEQLEKLAQEKETLEQRTDMLERILAMQSIAKDIDQQASSNGAAGTSSSRREVSFSERYSSMDTQKVVLTVKHGSPRELGAAQVAKLPWEEHVAIWQEYVRSLSGLLDNTESPEAQVQLQAWVRELSALQLAVVVLNPKGFRLFQIRRMDNFSQPEQHPTEELWRHVYEQMGLEPQQEEDLLMARRHYLQKLGTIVEKRRHLNLMLPQCLNGSLPDHPHLSDVARNYLSTSDAMDKLHRSLGTEQALLVQAMATTFQRAITPRQTAVQIVSSYPWYPDILAIVDVVAAGIPGEPTAAEILAVQDPEHSTQNNSDDMS
ncbi:hypothetical protein WJX74_001101 [Apatococcus lobatus]|uniref:BZIP domain-containing protein n=1 Tax=Apatococcus lobatus TaxID=904363 RepID=A0AAW1R1E6_9CHLO